VKEQKGRDITLSAIITSGLFADNRDFSQAKNLYIRKVRGTVPGKTRVNNRIIPRISPGRVRQVSPFLNPPGYHICLLPTEISWNWF